MKNTVDPKRIYQDISVGGATPIELVVILYNAALENMRRAVVAMKNSDVQTRATEVGHALLVLQQLQGTLDFEHGGQSAKQFEQFYNLIRAKLLEAQMRDSPELMQQQIRFMSEVRDCWIQAERQFQLKQKATRVSDTLTPDGGHKSEWNA